MTLKEYLNSNLLPRVERTPDIWSHESYWGLPDSLSLYSAGFNRAEYKDQCHPLIMELQDMNPEKYRELSKYEDCEVVRVNCVSASDCKLAIHIQIKTESH